MSARTRETAARSAIADIARQRGTIRTSAKTAVQRPTGKQVYRAFYLLCEIADITPPETVAEASELIAHLVGQRDALAASTATTTFDAGF